GIRDATVTGVQTCALPILHRSVIRERRDRHQSLEREVRQRGQLLGQLRRLGGGAAGLLGFLGHVHLQQRAHPHALRRRSLVELRRERERVERMHQGEATRDVLRLVALQVPDQVPRRAAAGRGVDLLQRLLYAVLTQVGEARGARRRYGVQPEPL